MDAFLSQKKKMKRARTTNTQHLACNGTLEVLYMGRHSDFVVRQVGPNCDFEDGFTTDSVDLVIHFRPPLPAATGGTLIVQYVGSKCVESPTILSQPLLPLDQGVALVLRDTELEYRCFPSYNAHVKNGAVLALYVSIDNTKTSAAAGAVDLVLQPHINTRLHFMKQHLGERGRFLDWFPPDVDPAQWGLRIDPRRIPQRTPLWFKLRGDVSGSKAYSLLGWFCDNKPMTAFQKSAMRLGTHSEDLIVLAYFHTFPDRIFEEFGWCPAPGYPIGWGASPDGMVEDPGMTWEQVPEPTRSYYYNKKDVRPITCGACEFKTSRTKLALEAYFLAQVYMEMMALQVVWCDLVRYRPSREWNQEQGVWHYKDEAHVYRIFRDPNLEARMIPLWKRAQANQHALQKIVAEDEYVAIREHLESLAVQHQPYHKIVMTAPLEELLRSYQDYRKPPAAAPAAAAAAPLDPIWTTMALRHEELQKCHDPVEFIQMVAEQIKAYASLL